MIRDKQRQAAPKPGARMALSAAAAIVLASFALAPTGALAEDSVAWGQKIWQDKAGCNYCHGWAGDGVGGFHHPGRPPSLRATELTRDQIRVTIQCGRPGTAMPHFDRFAYTDKRCYDMTAAISATRCRTARRSRFNATKSTRSPIMWRQRSRAWARLPNSNATIITAQGQRLARCTLPRANERHPFTSFLLCELRG
jgi:hypothetical protein